MMNIDLQAVEGAVVVGVDGSDTARFAARRAAGIAAETGRPLLLVSAISESTVRGIRDIGSDHYQLDPYSMAEHMLLALAADLKASSPAPVGVSTAVSVATPADALIAEAARVNASMIVIGNRGVQTAIRLTPSIAGAVTHRAPCDVLVVHTYAGRKPSPEVAAAAAERRHASV